jgi:hypothetical protein
VLTSLPHSLQLTKAISSVSKKAWTQGASIFIRGGQGNPSSMKVDFIFFHRQPGDLLNSATNEIGLIVLEKGVTR